MQISLITDIPSYRASSFPGARIIEWSGDKRRHVTAEEFLELTGSWIARLQQQGVGRGDHVATFSISTRIAVLAAEFAAMQLGAIVCPLHANSAPADVRDMLLNILPHFTLVPDAAHQQFLEKKAGPDIRQQIVNLDTPFEPTIPDGTRPPQVAEPALIISTSGTTGEAKGVVLSHHNVISVAIATAAVIPLHRRHVVISFLPVSHILERIAIYTGLMQGVDIHLAENPRHGYSILRQVHPHYITAVPRILERIFSRFQLASEDAGFFQRQIFTWASKQGTYGNRLSRFVARLFVMGKLRQLFGVRIKGIIVGGAAMNPEIIRWFATAGLAVRQGYGLSEVAGVATFNRFIAGQFKVDSVGLPIPGVEVRIERSSGDDMDSGEILIAGPGLMIGYLRHGQIEYRDADDKWFATGDLGYIDSHGFLFITGRIKDNFKNASGQYVAPSRIERLLRSQIAVDNTMVVGLAKPFTSAIIRPDFEFAKQWASTSGVHWTAEEYMIYNPDMLAYFQKVVATVNAQLSPHEQILKFALVFEEWNSENGLLTPTHKLRRGAIQEKYKKVIRDVYS